MLNMQRADPSIKIRKKINIPAGVVSLWFTLVSAGTTVIPLREDGSAGAGGSTERVLIASGASRSWVGWTVGTEQESSDLRAKFKVNLRQCDIDVLEQTALAVSDPASSRYGDYLSAAQVCEIVSCPDRKQAVRGVLEWLLGPRVEGGHTVRELVESEGEQGRWLISEAGRGDDSDDVAAKVYCSHVAVSMSAKAATAAFPEADFRPHLKAARSSARGKDRAVLRATGDIFIPESLSGHVEFVSGLTELWPGAGTGKLDGARAGLGGHGGMETGDFTEVMIQPRTLRALYSVPEEERGEWAGRGNNRQGVVAFDDFFLPADLCAAHNLLGRSSYSEWLDPPDVTVLGPEFDPEADEVESDLDTQYMTLMGAGVPVTFANHDSGQWVLDWAQEAAEGDLTPERGGPLVWSISYGFPEEWQCYVSDSVCSDGDENSGSLYGYDPIVYMTRSNDELAKLASLGVSVLVSSGDDGAGQLATCPVDPRFPVDVSGGTVEGAETTCPFDDREDCKCGSFQMELQHNSTASSRCILPLGLVESALGIGAPGGDCVEVLNAPDCLNLLENIENTTMLSSDGVQEHRFYGGRGVASSPACQMAFSAANFSFYSDCECGAVPPITVGNCSMSGYTFQKGRDGSTPFAPPFPGSSPWVTSVGATQVAWDLKGSCLQADLLGPDNVRNAETAVNRFTGGFDGGGGFSTIFEAPTYQKASVERYVDSQAIPRLETFNSTNRGFPDVSAAGHNYVFVTGGKVQQIGGTSASAPALAGMVSLMNERLLVAGKPPLGFLNPALYKAAEDGAPVFRPILPKTYDFSGTPLEKTLGPTYQVGSNKCSRYSCCQMGYDGSPDGSWDPVTGLGTINYQALAEYLNVPPSPAPPVPGRGHDRHHAAYVAWIVVLVFALASAVTFLVYEYRPKLLLSAVHLGKSMKDVSGGDGEMSGFDSDEVDGRSGGVGGWMGVAASGGYGRRRARGRDRPRGALTEMVMESEFGALGGDADYRLLEDENDGRQEEEDQESVRRSV